METLDILMAYRRVANELRMIHKMEDSIRSSLTPRRDKDTSDRLTRKIAQFEALAAAAESRQTALKADFDRVMNTVTDERGRVILLQYYGLAMNDTEIGELMGYCTRTINKYRNRCLQRFFTTDLSEPNNERRLS